MEINVCLKILSVIAPHKNRVLWAIFIVQWFEVLYLDVDRDYTKAEIINSILSVCLYLSEKQFLKKS